jgi:WD40 repeat protein
MRHQRRARRRVVMAASAVMAVAGVFAGSVMYQNMLIQKERDVAVRNERLAVENEMLAVANEARAVENEIRAIAGEEDAVRHAGEAVRQAELAEENRMLAEGHAQEARNQAGIAETNRETAETQRILAETNREIAEANRELAEQNAEEARLQAEIAETNRALAEEHAREARLQAGIAETNRELAETQREIAETQRELAETNRGIAENNWALAEHNLDIANRNYRELQITESLGLASLSALQMFGGDRIGAVQSALAALPSEGNERPMVNEAAYALSRAVHAYGSPDVLRTDRTLRHSGYVRNIITSADGSRVVTADNADGLYIWDAVTGRVVAQFNARADFYAPMEFSAFNGLKDGRLFVKLAGGNVVCINVLNGAVVWRRSYDLPNAAPWIEVSGCNTRVAIGDKNGLFVIIDAANGDALLTIREEGAEVSAARFSEDGRFFYISRLTRNRPTLRQFDSHMVSYDLTSGTRRHIGTLTDMRIYDLYADNQFLMILADFVDGRADVQDLMAFEVNTLAGVWGFSSPGTRSKTNLAVLHPYRFINRLRLNGRDVTFVAYASDIYLIDNQMGTVLLTQSIQNTLHLFDYINTPDGIYMATSEQLYFSGYNFIFHACSVFNVTLTAEGAESRFVYGYDRGFEGLSLAYRGGRPLYIYSPFDARRNLIIDTYTGDENFRTAALAGYGFNAYTWEGAAVDRFEYNIFIPNRNGNLLLMYNMYHSLGAKRFYVLCAVRAEVVTVIEVEPRTISFVGNVFFMSRNEIIICHGDGISVYDALSGALLRSLPAWDIPSVAVTDPELGLMDGWTFALSGDESALWGYYGNYAVRVSLQTMAFTEFKFDEGIFGISANRNGDAAAVMVKPNNAAPRIETIDWRGRRTVVDANFSTNVGYDVDSRSMRFYGDIFAVLDERQRILVYGGGPITVIEGAAPILFEFSPTGQSIFAVCRDGSVRQYSAFTGELLNMVVLEAEILGGGTGNVKALEEYAVHAPLRFITVNGKDYLIARFQYVGTVDYVICLETFVHVADVPLGVAYLAATNEFAVANAAKDGLVLYPFYTAEDLIRKAKGIPGIG